MIDRGDGARATTPQGRELALWLLPHAAIQANRGSQFDGMKRMFGKAEGPPSDDAGTLAS